MKVNTSKMNIRKREKHTWNRHAAFCRKTNKLFFFLSSAKHQQQTRAYAYTYTDKGPTAKKAKRM